MLNMSKAAIAPKQPIVSKADENHPLYGKYREYVAGMNVLGVQAQDFSGYVYCYNRDKTNDEYAAMPEFKEFQKWMRETKAGARKCRPTKDMPYGLSFPENFKVWLTGERW